MTEAESRRCSCIFFSPTARFIGCCFVTHFFMENFDFLNYVWRFFGFFFSFVWYERSAPFADNAVSLTLFRQLPSGNLCYTCYEWNFEMSFWNICLDPVNIDRISPTLLRHRGNSSCRLVMRWTRVGQAATIMKPTHILCSPPSNSYGINYTSLRPYSFTILYMTHSHAWFWGCG